MEKNFMDNLKKEILKSTVVSFDIFDTLMFRLVSRPEDIFRIIEKNLKIDNFSEIRQRGQMEASLKAEKSGNPHADMDEIYKYLNDNYNIGCDWNKIKEYEIMLEKDSLKANAQMKEIFLFAKKEGKRVIATSDMYLKRKEIEEFLLNCGYDGFDEIYISADLRRTKYRCDLFEYVISKEGVAPDKIIHIGDNYQADFLNAKKVGLNAVHYNAFEQDKTIYDELFTSVDKGIIKVMNGRCDIDFWYKLGYQVGGSMYLGLFKWVKDKIKNNKDFDKVYFLARDGFNLYNIFKNLGYKNIEYLYASRRAMLLAGIDKLDDNAIASMPPYTFYQSVGEILEYLGFNDISEESIKKCGFSGLDDKIKSHEDFDKMKNLYKKNEKYILEKCKEERAFAKKYYEKIGLLNSKSLIFDCGWNGSSQYLLDNVLKLCNYKGENKFLYSGIMNTEKSKRQLANKNFECFFFGHNFNTYIENIVRRPIVLFELFFGANHNSVWKYDKNGYVLENLEKEQNHKLSILKGIEDYIKQAEEFVDKYNIEISANSAVLNLIRLINNPTVEEATKIGNLKNVDGFVAQKGVEKYIAKLDLITYLKNSKTEIYWPQGILKRKDTNIILKRILQKKFNISKEKVLKNNKISIGSINRFYQVLKREGLATTLFLVKQKFSKEIKNVVDKYQKWIEINEKDILKTTELNYKPLISIVVPVYNVLSEQLIDCIESVKAQTYKNWELCLVDDFSSWESVRDVLKKYENDERIKIVYRKENGHISRATNDGINIAKGEFIAFLDCDDIVAPNAIYEVTKKLNEDKEIDFVYSDEDKLSENGKLRHSPFFKPDWSPDTFMSLMYTCHFSVYRKSIVDKINGLNVGVEGAQDYDFTLRFTENAKKIAHIHKILYHWRERPESIASNPEAKPYALEAIKKLKYDALKRRGLEGEVVYSEEMYQFTVKYDTVKNEDVSIIIAVKDDIQKFERTYNSIKDKAGNSKIIVVVSEVNAELVKIIEKACKNKNCSLIKTSAFNYAAMFNAGAEAIDSKSYIFIESGIEIKTADFIRCMAGHTLVGNTGVVGLKILYSNSDLIYHSGITALDGEPVFSFRGYSNSCAFYYGRNKLDYNVSAVGGGVLAISKKALNEIKGFDTDFGDVYYDIAACFSLLEKGYYNVLRNDSIAERFDVNINETVDNANQIEMLNKKYEKLCFYDSCYNNNLTKYNNNFDIASYFELKSSKKIRQYKDINKIKSDDVVAIIDSVNKEEKYAIIQGWAFINKFYHNNFNQKYLTLTNDNGVTIVYSTQTMLRDDVTRAFGEYGSKTLSGFKCVIKTSELKKGNYKIGVLIKNNVYANKRHILTDKMLCVK